jgi:hypothetical protein
MRDRIVRLQQDVDALVVRLLRRLPRGLTRRRPIPLKRERAWIETTTGTNSCALADTS